MFSRNKEPPQRTPFSLKREQLIEDIQKIYKDEEQRSKLYLCLDEKPPHEPKFAKIDEFLRDQHNLEENAEKLADLIYDVESYRKDVLEKVRELEKTCGEVLGKYTDF